MVLLYVRYWPTGLDFKACTWLSDFLPIFPKIAVRQTVGGRGAVEGNSRPCKPFSPTQYICGMEGRTRTSSHANFARLTPFGARKDWTRGVTRHFVALAVLKEVVPKGRRSAFRPQRHSHLREDGRAAVVHIRHVRQPRRNAVPGAEALESVLFFALRTEPIHVCVRDGA